MIEDVKYNDRKYIDRAEQAKEADKPKPPKKEGKSPFDELLEQSQRLQQGSVDTKSQDKRVLQQAAKEVEKRQERQRDQSKDREREDEHRQNTRDERSPTQSVTKKVVGKAGLKEQQGGGGEHASEGGGGFSRKKESSSAAAKKSEMAPAPLQKETGAFGKAFKIAMSQYLPKTLSQEILNKVVQYVRIGLSRKGNKEIELELHEKIFKGLRLRLESNRGKVTLHFLAANAQTRALFERESSKIRAHLENRGIDVAKVMVT